MVTGTGMQAVRMPFPLSRSLNKYFDVCLFADSRRDGGSYVAGLMYEVVQSSS